MLWVTVCRKYLRIHAVNDESTPSLVTLQNSDKWSSHIRCCGILLPQVVPLASAFSLPCKHDADSWATVCIMNVCFITISFQKITVYTEAPCRILKLRQPISRLHHTLLGMFIHGHTIIMTTSLKGLQYTAKTLWSGGVAKYIPMQYFNRLSFEPISVLALQQSIQWPAH